MEDDPDDPDLFNDFDRFIDFGPALISGLIDNSVKGEITGHLVLAGLGEPLELRLQGNAAPDLAGCVLRFRRQATMPIDPIDPEDADIITSPHHGIALRVSAASHTQWEDEDGNRHTARCLEIDWVHFGTLTRFVIGLTGCSFEIDLPRWTLSEEDIEQQRRQWHEAEELFETLLEEFEDELLDEAISEEQFEKIDAILPELEQLETDEDREALMRKVLGPDVSEEDIQGLMEAYFGDDFDSSDDLPF